MSAFGIYSVSGRRRVAYPPARIRTGINSAESFMRADSGTLEFKAEPDFLQSLFPHRMAQAWFVLGVKHEKASAPGANQLAAGRTVGEGAAIPMIDLFICHERASSFLMLPVNIHQAAELGYISAFQRT